MHSKRRNQIFHYILARAADRQPDKVFMRLDERRLTYAETELASNRLAHGLRGLGVGKGDRVLLMIPNELDGALLWLALCKLGAIMVPMNDAYRGAILLYQVNNSEAAHVIIDSEHLLRFLEIKADLQYIKHVILYKGDDESRIQARELGTVCDLAALFDANASHPPEVVDVWDPMAIFYTSGTTGPSKGVLYSHGQAFAATKPMAGPFDASDTLYYFSPIHHVVMPIMFGATLLKGASLAMRSRFSMEHFWPDVRQYGATIVLFLGAVSNFVYRQPARPDDHHHTLRKVLMVPLIKELDDFRRRFNCEVFTWFNMTEVNTPIHSDGFSLIDNKSCGRVRAGTIARLVDALDEPVGPGEVGELVLRTEEPWELNLGYWRNPEKTVEAWRNLWFHTGDLFSCDAEGNFYFVDRLKDAIRRRGENISSFEVEAEINAHPAVLECAAVAVTADDAEEEIKAVICLKPGASLDPVELLEFLAPRTAYFMLPRYIQIVTVELEKTPTGKIRKGPLREAGTVPCWDRVAAGYKLRR